MIAHRHEPCLGNRFLVSIGEQDGRDPAAGFAEVIFPPFDHGREGDALGADAARPLLILRRGVTGRLDLYEWWDAARHHKTPPTRTVMIQLLGDGERPVLTWRFLGAHPVTLTYSPLNAMSGSVVMEQVALAFERVEMA